MGATCSPRTFLPERSHEPNVETKIDVAVPAKASGDDTTERFTNLINDYQATNEKLRNEMDSLKNMNDEFIMENEEKTKRNEEVMRELNQMKILVDAKNRALLKGRLRAALLSSMLSMESTSRLCIKGELVQLQMERKINKYVVVRVCDGEVFPDDYKSGYVVLTYYDGKDAATAERYEVLNVMTDKSDKKEKPENKEKDVGREYTVTIRVSAGGVVEDLTFLYETAKWRDDWVRAIATALSEVRSTYAEMHDLFTLTLEFAKKKMGIRVEESLLPEEEEEKSVRIQMRESHIVTKKIDFFEKRSPRSTTTTAESTKKEILETSGKDEIEESQEEEEEEDSKFEEDPCELLVTNITDEDLTAAGLRVNCIVRAINNKSLAGLGYSEQLDLLMKTPKPYTLTFTGKNFLKHEPEREHGYHSILKELTADEENSVKRAFNELVVGTSFGKELEASTNKGETIHKLLSNQRRLMALLKKINIQDIEL